MKTIDLTTRNFLKDNRHFTDLMNTFVFHENVLDYRTLRDLDTRKDLRRMDGRLRARIRDLIKAGVVIKTNGKQLFMIMGVEGQGSVDYAMPIRSLVYEASDYSVQLEKNLTQSGHYPKGKKILPVLTLVIYLGEGRWTAPTSLKEMMEEEIVEKFGHLISDHRFILIDSSQMEDEEILKAATDLKAVLLAKKYMGDEEKFKEVFQSILTNGDQIVSLEGAELISMMIGYEIPIQEEEGGVDMCKALDDWSRRERSEGREEGRQEGRKEGRKEGVDDVFALMKLAGVSAEQMSFISEMLHNPVRNTAY